MKRKETGSAGEKLAQAYLKKRGYRIIETNYRCPEGEIDIIARHKDYLVFIEVRTKRSAAFGSPEESITAIKMAHLRSAAARYQQGKTGLPQMWRIDVVAVELAPNGRATRIDVIENAVGEG